MTEFGRYLKQCPAALKDKTRTLSLLKDALKNDLPKFRVLQAAYELGILEAIQRSNPISTDDRLKITTGLVSQYAMLENAAKNAIDYWQATVYKGLQAIKRNKWFDRVEKVSDFPLYFYIVAGCAD